eukprot:TRINITY_DN13610_c0_g1_i1.p1 TRINITY_DN13610_c0_g1~~TRINITY_DN13610_c0_g1_i1.p1  ORF type:complete len:307 (-),score=100.25 TRINITY_DN13610_c0_g1_i1:37-957(-)
MKTALLLVIFSLFATIYCKNYGVLVVTDDVSDINNLIDVLESLRYNVTIINYNDPVPSNLESQFVSIWIEMVFRTLPSQWENALDLYVKSNGILFFGDNQGCCKSADTSIAKFINDHTYTSNVDTKSPPFSGSCLVDTDANSDISCLTRTPNYINGKYVTFLAYSAFSGDYRSDNIFLGDNTLGVTGLAFGESDLTNGNEGAIVAVLDVNWSSGNQVGIVEELVENIQTFLIGQCGRVTPTPVPSPPPIVGDEDFQCCVYYSREVSLYDVTCVLNGRDCLPPPDYQQFTQIPVSDCKQCYPFLFEN